MYHPKRGEGSGLLTTQVLVPLLRSRLLWTCFVGYVYFTRCYLLFLPVSGLFVATTTVKRNQYCSLQRWPKINALSSVKSSEVDEESGISKNDITWTVPLTASVTLPADASESAVELERLSRSVHSSTQTKLSRILQGHKSHTEKTMRLLQMEIELAKKSEGALKYHLFKIQSESQTPPSLLSTNLERNKDLLAECLDRNFVAVERLLQPISFHEISVARNPDLSTVEGNANDGNKEKEIDYWGSGGVADGKTDSKESEGYDTALQVVNHVSRDWTEGGQPCRQQTNGWILTELLAWHRSRNGGGDNKDAVSVLVPGAGLGRLAFDIANVSDFKAVVEANDSSAVMAAAARSMLSDVLSNVCKNDNDGSTSSFVLHPFVTDPKSNEVDSNKRFDSVICPDNLAIEAFRRRLPSLSYTVGDFVATYSSPSKGGQFDVIATSFFVDTASNIYEYVAIMKHLLRSSGSVWINVGPVQWHPCAWLRPTVDEFRDILTASGFELLKWEVAPDAVGYRHPDDVGTNLNPPRYTRSESYRPLRFVAVKKSDENEYDEDEPPPLHMAIDYCEYVGRIAQGK